MNVKRNVGRLFLYLVDKKFIKFKILHDSNKNKKLLYKQYTENY